MIYLRVTITDSNGRYLGSESTSAHSLASVTYETILMTE